MGFFDRFRKPQQATTFTQDESFADTFRGQPIHYDIRRLSPSEMWETQPHLRTVVSFLARNIAQLGLHSFERIDETDRRRDRESIAARVLRRPNSQTTTFELIFSLVGDLALYDVAYWHVAQDADAPSGWAIVRIPVEWVTPKNANAFERKAYLVKAPGGSEVTFPAEEILVFHGFNPLDPRDGSTPVSALKGVLQEQLQSSLYRQQVWKNGGRVSAVLNRPVGAPAWSNEAREQFREDWYAKYTGNGSKAGGTPILEDGMTLERIDFSAKDQEYVEGAKLSFATVCSAYHVNPTMVGLLDNANFSNVREFRRMLYGDTLGPILAQIEDRLNTFLLPMLGMDDATHYVEFNIDEKMQGNFEEQSAAMQASTGAPWMTRNEARALRNMPAIEGGDDLVTPLNVLVGGQASPRDSAPKALAPVVQLKARPTEPQASKAEQVLSKFFDRQAAVVLSRIGAKADDWWDEKRWDDELTADLLPVAHSIAEAIGTAEAKRLGFEGGYDADRTVEFLKAVSARHAGNVNATTKDQLDAAIANEEADPADVFTQAKASRAAGIAGIVTTFAAGFGTVEAGRQIAQANDVAPTKTWITGSNPRASHAAMNGEKVGIDEPFSNGLDWPGSGGDAAEVAGCNCSVEIEF